MLTSGSSGAASRTSRRWLAASLVACILGFVTAAEAAPDIACDPMTRMLRFREPGKGAVVIEKLANGVEETRTDDFAIAAGSQYRLVCNSGKCRVPYTDVVTQTNGDGPGSSIISHMDGAFYPADVFCYLARTITVANHNPPANIASHAAAIKAGLRTLVGYEEGQTLKVSEGPLFHGTSDFNASTIVTKGIRLVGNGITGLGFYTTTSRPLAVEFGRLHANPSTLVKMPLKRDLPVCKIPPPLKNDHVVNVFAVNVYGDLLDVLGVSCAFMRNSLTHNGVTGTEVVFRSLDQLDVLASRGKEQE
jgi:hypothetical protein